MSTVVEATRARGVPADAMRDSLAPLCAALLAAATAEADRLREEADADARHRLETARHQADTLVAEARADGEADASWVLTTERTAARRAARGVVLAAQREAYEQLRRASLVAVRALLAEPAARDGLAALLRARLPGATLRDLDDGGLAAEAADGRRVDASAEALVDRALRSVDGARLWEPA